MRPDPQGPLDLRDLDYGEHLVVWAFRAFATGRACPIVRREFDHGCGEAAPEAFAAMQAFVQQLAVQGRRPIVLAPPGCLTLVRDEQLVICTFAAVQAGERERFAAHFRWLAAAAPSPSLEMAAGIVTAALARKGHRLRLLAPVRAVDPDIGAAPPPRRLAAK